ncbi:ribulose-phosphate 3-epimerase [Buchnera aphidicola (Pemphigus obesinymphae)]|uniref:ribulose-phosphate 3-epimerase n=1 Tax=Buchnera aphidicola TaxID=9 RepID=UPI002237F656|nr:ribulose-phosphate 3-epimerase [Buchnera aphidicola]MCW5196433.1 ribulose-phosphate 3-epimerase [Buchnera aphidicola (Pemphigus obesinymphae)]
MKIFFLASSILSADFARLGDETKKVLDSGIDMVHFDVMDNHFVPNLTMGPMVLRSLRQYKIHADIDVHLMTKPVDNLIPQFALAGANYITVHPESTDHLDRTLDLIKFHGCKVGLGFNPATPIGFLDYVMDKLDMILLMSVNPGFGGQDFIPSALEKLREVRKKIDKSAYNILLAVDGGVKVNNIANIALAGANVFIVGSAIFNSNNYQKTIRNMRDELDSVSHGVIH